MNPLMPRTLGDTFLHLDKINHLVLVETPITEYLHPPVDAGAEEIARYIASIIDDGSSLQSLRDSEASVDMTKEISYKFLIF